MHPLGPAGADHAHIRQPRDLSFDLMRTKKAREYLGFFTTEARFATVVALRYRYGAGIILQRMWISYNRSCFEKDRLAEKRMLEGYQAR